MSYIELSTKVKPTDRLVLSLWFRVPGKTLASIRSEYTKWKDAQHDDPPPPRRRFLGIVPLLTFGAIGLKAKKVYTHVKSTGNFPGLFDYSWTDGTGGSECVGAGWNIAGHSGLPGTGTEGDSGAGPWKENYLTLTEGGTLFSEDFELDGSYIGVDVTDPSGTAFLSVNIVMPVKNTPKEASALGEPDSNTWSGTVRNYTGSGICPGSPGVYAVGPDDPLLGGSICYTETFYTLSTTESSKGSVDAVMASVPETFRTLPAANAGAINTLGNADTDQVYKGPEITPDHWHHMLLSVDLRNDIRTKGQLVSRSVNGGSGGSGSSPDNNTESKRTASTCKMWMAIDDVDCTKDQLSSYWPRGGADKTANDILSVNGFNVAARVNTNVTSTNNIVAACHGVNLTTVATSFTPTYNYTPAKFDIGLIGLPAVREYVDAIRHVEMGELEIFTDVCFSDMDIPPEDKQTNKNEVFRRAFITDKGKPVGRGKARELFGKDPEVLLNRAANWKKGRNTGSLAMPPPTGPEDGVAVGKINTYRPSPNLYNEQGGAQ